MFFFVFLCRCSSAENTTYGTVQPNPEVRLKAASFNKIVEKMTSADPEREMLRKVRVLDTFCLSLSFSLSLSLSRLGLSCSI